MLAYIGSLPAMEPFIMLGKIFTCMFFIFFFLARFSNKFDYLYIFVIIIIIKIINNYVLLYFSFKFMITLLSFFIKYQNDCVFFFLKFLKYKKRGLFELKYYINVQFYFFLFCFLALLELMAMQSNDVNI